jgi:hypothetical protein
MSKWKFWEKQPEDRTSSPDSETPRRFSARPRTDLIDPRATADPQKAEKLARLRRRRETVLFDVEQSEMALSPDNPWEQRVALIDEALAAVRLERDRLRAEREPPGHALDPIPVTDVDVTSGPPPGVRFKIGQEQFHYEEELDWAERGFQVARSELHLQSGDAYALVSPQLDSSERDRLAAHLIDSIFSFASDLRDKVLAGERLPEGVTLSDLARPDHEHGGWLEWNGTSPLGARKAMRLKETDAEEQRLLDERSKELEEMAKLADRLPIARRRLADVDAEIAALGT